MKNRLSDEVFRYLIEQQVEFLVNEKEKDHLLFALGVGEIVKFQDLEESRQDYIIENLPNHLKKCALEGLTPLQEKQVKRIVQSAIDTGSA